MTQPDTGAGSMRPVGAHVHTNHCWWNHDEASWVCASTLSATDGVFRDEPSLVDVRDMMVVHAAMLREFRLAPAAVQRVHPGSTKAATIVDRHLGFLCGMLQHHHQAEDELLWPLLRERVPATAVRLVNEVESQHRGIETRLGAVAAARADWVGDPTESGRATFVRALTQLHSELKEHLDLEERAVLPLAAGLLSETEWRAIGDAAKAGLPKPALALAFGMFAYEGDPVVLRSMLASAPVVPRLLIPLIAPRVYARRAREVHGAARP